MKNWIKITAAALLSVMSGTTNSPKDDMVERIHDKPEEPVVKDGDANDISDIGEVAITPPKQTIAADTEVETNLANDISNVEEGITAENEAIVHDHGGHKIILPTSEELAEMLKDLNLDSEDDVIFGYKANEQTIIFHSKDGKDISCTLMNANDDDWRFGSGVDTSGDGEPIATSEKPPEFFDGGWTNGLSFGCTTDFGENEFSAIFKHDMYTAQTKSATGEAVEGQRPAGGEFSLTIGEKTDLLKLGPLNLDRYFEAKIGYREVDVTKKIQDTVHGLMDVPERDYATEPMESGWTADASVGLSAKMKLKLPGNLKILSGPFAGITAGDYSGNILGYSFSLGTDKQNYDVGIPFKTDTSPTAYSGSGLGKEGDWNLSISTGVRNIQSDSRFREGQFQEDVRFTNITIIKQITPSTYIITGIGVSDNPAKIGSDIVPNYSMGIGTTFGKKSKTPKIEPATKPEPRDPIQEKRTQLPFIERKDKDGGFER